MREDQDGFRGEEDWFAEAVIFQPEQVVNRAPPKPARNDRRALALAILGVICFGFVFGPLALIFGQRARVAMVEGSRHESGRMTQTAITVGKLGMALHLTLAICVVPWLLFMLPLLNAP
jgi:hypothetical protein